MSASLEHSDDWKRSVFIPTPNKGNAKECSNYHTSAVILHAIKIMLKIIQARLQHYFSRELLDVQVEFRKGRRTRDQIANIHWIIEKTREFQKNIYFCFFDYAKLKPLTMWITTNYGKYRDGNTRPPYLPPKKPVCWLRSTVRTRHGKMDWFNIKKGVHQGCILPSYLFRLYAEYIMWNIRPESQAGIKIAKRNINNLRYANDTILMAESKEELTLFNIKSWLKSQHSKNWYHGIWSHHVMANRWGNNRNSDRLNFVSLQNHWKLWMQPCSLKAKLWQT